MGTFSISSTAPYHSADQTGNRECPHFSCWQSAAASVTFSGATGIEVDVAHAIQLAVAPVFMLSGVGVVLGVLTARLSRIVDRARLINIAITLITITALPALVVAGCAG